MDEKRVNLKDVEPLRPVESLETEGDRLVSVDHGAKATPAMVGSTPAMGVSLEKEHEPAPQEEDDLDRLRRG